MRIFNTVQELWDYCSFCPICQEDGRRIELKVGPDPVFQLVSSNKTKNQLDLECVYRKVNNHHRVKYQIDCLDNTFDVTISEVLVDDTQSEIPQQKVKKAYFYLYVQSFCKICNSAHTYSSDLELNFLQKKISNIRLEQESFFLLREIDKFHVAVMHDENYVTVARCHGLDDLDFEEDRNKIKLPMFDLDLSNQAKLVDRIKTLILFS